MLVSTTLFVFLAIFQPISCWGSFGHRTVAYLAQKHFTAGTHRFVDRLLENDQGFDISDASLWADGRVKRDNPRTRQWHWIGMCTYQTFIKGRPKEYHRCKRQASYSLRGQLPT